VKIKTLLNMEVGPHASAPDTCGTKMTGLGPYLDFFVIEHLGDPSWSYSNVAFLAAVVFLSLVFRYLGQSRPPHRPFPELPMPPNPHWLLGHLRYLLWDDFQMCQREVIQKQANEYGQLGVWYGSRRGVAVFSWRDAKLVLHSEYHRSRPVPLRKHLAMFLGTRSIGNMVGREWKLHRSWIMKTLSPRVVVHYKATVELVAQKLVDSITRKHLPQPAGEWISDVEELMKMITIDVFAMVGLGVDLQCCENLLASDAAAAFGTLCEELATRLGKPFSIPNYFYSFPCERNRKHFEARTCIRQLLRNQIEERQKDDADCTRKDDLLGALLDSYRSLRKDVDGDARKQEDLDEMLSDMLMALFFAGFDTVAITMTYAIYLISIHPEVERNCLEEIESMPSAESESVYFKGVIMETLRMYPPAPIIPRTLLKPVELTGGFQAPTGTQVLIPIWLVQNIEENFPQPDQFRPDRWVRRRISHENDDDEGHQPGLWVERGEETDDVMKSGTTIPPGNRNAFFAFSGGGRSCPGQKFAMQEAVVALRCLLGGLQFTAVPSYKLTPRRQGLVQRPLGGMPMKIRRRTGVST
jgi:cytochrome P450